MRHIYLSLGILLTLTESIVTSCPEGYYKVGRGNCTDEDECESEPSICGKNARCHNTIGSYYCLCYEGFTPTHNFTQKTGTECQDINECVDGSTVCGPNAECNNTEGGYFCTCKTGYISSNGKQMFSAGQGIQCIGVCDIDKSLCGEGGVCHNSKDGHECVCRSGFTNYGHKQMKCTDINECVNGSTVCGPNAKCNNAVGNYSCTCEPGYFLRNGNKTFIAGQGIQCVCDIDKSLCGEVGVCHKESASQASPKLTELVSLMTNSCLVLKENNFTQVDGERLLEAFLSALDSLLQGDFQGDNHKVSAMFNIVESMLKLIGPLLSESQTKRSSTETEVELLVKWGKSPPEGDFNISSSRTQFTSHWDTATGNTYLGFTTAALLSYKGLEESLNHYFDHLTIDQTRKKQTFKINSKVVTATVSNTETDNLQKPVNLTFSHLENTNETHICVFWDPKLKGGAWSQEGCTRVNSSDVQTVCSCTHLSSFAVLMALYDIGDVYKLTLITWVGLPLSLVCLLICIITFYLVRSIQSTRNTIHLHLCISLFIAYFVFLVGITRTENEVGCAVVAGVLHYFFLASFCWMCLEGVQLFRMVVLVFNTTLRPIYMIAAGYGVPAVIVAISATVNASGYGTQGYCWLNIQDGFIWSFYGPVCAIIIVNVFFFLITIWKLAEKFSSLNPDLNNLHKIKTFTVTAIAQLCVLGIMWVFGCFQFNKDTLVMSYIFTILSSLQGVLMFIMHCWLPRQVREEYAKFLSRICTPQKRKYSEFSSNQTSKSQGSKSVQHTGESHI